MTQKPKRRLSRRTFLGGAAAAITLPFLEAMIPRGLRADTLNPAGRAENLIFYYVPNGMRMSHWTPTSEGSNFSLTPILEPLSTHRSDLLVLTGLANRPGTPDGAGDHAAGTGSFLTCAHVYKTEGEEIYNGISVDQVAAKQLGQTTDFASLQIGIEGGSGVGNCDSGYSCAYSRNISWASPTTPLPKITHPQIVFDRLFAGFDPKASAEERERRHKFRKSVLDTALEDAKNLDNQLGQDDRQKLGEYLDSVRSLETRMERLANAPVCEAETPENMAGFSDDPERHIALMNDLMVLALRCNKTHVISFMLGNAGSNRSYDFIGVSGGHHQLSHHQDREENLDQLTQIARWEMQQFGALLTRLKNTSHLDGSLLDNTIVFFSSEVADGNKHEHHNLPVLLAGRGGGSITPGRHVRYAKEEPIADLYIGLLHAAGVQAERFGDDGSKPLDGLRVS